MYYNKCVSHSGIGHITLTVSFSFIYYFVFFWIEMFLWKKITWPKKADEKEKKNTKWKKSLHVVPLWVCLSLSTDHQTIQVKTKFIINNLTNKAKKQLFQNRVCIFMTGFKILLEISYFVFCLHLHTEGFHLQKDLLINKKISDLHFWKHKESDLQDIISSLQG